MLISDVCLFYVYICMDLCNVLSFSMLKLNQDSIFARKMLNFVKHPINYFINLASNKVC